MKQNKEVETSERSNMEYKKPQIVAKSEPKQSYVAGCPQLRVYMGCHSCNANCMGSHLK